LKYVLRNRGRQNKDKENDKAISTQCTSSPNPVLSSKNLDDIMTYLSKEWEVNLRNSDPYPLLAAAAKKGDLPAIQALIRAGANVNSHDKKGKTALDVAVENRQFEVALSLLQAGALNGYSKAVVLYYDNESTTPQIQKIGKGGLLKKSNPFKRSITFKNVGKIQFYSGEVNTFLAHFLKQPVQFSGVKTERCGISSCCTRYTFQDGTYVRIACDDGVRFKSLFKP